MLIILLGVLAIMVGVLSYLTRPTRLNNVLVSLLEDSIGCTATVGRAQLTWDGLLTVDGIDLTVPDARGQMSQLMHADRVVVQLRMWALLTGRVRAASVAISQPTLYLTEDLDRDVFNYELLLTRPPGEPDAGGLPTALPEMYLNGGEVRFGHIEDGGYKATQSLLLNGTLSADTDRPGGYTFILTQSDDTRDTQALGPLIQGQIDLNEPGVELRVDRFAFTGPHRYLMPSAMRAWWNRLSPRGALPRVVFSARLDETDQVKLAAEMELEGIGLSLPLNGEDPLELTNVSGQVSLSQGVVSFQEVTGEVDHVAFTSEGRIDGLEWDAPFSITLSTDPFEVPAEGGIWGKLPPSITKYRDRFSPQGRYQTSITLQRDPASDDVKLLGHLDLLETTFSYYRFPYPADSLTGRISFEGDRIVLKDLVGIGPSGGRGVVSGTIGPPIKDGRVDITIRGTDMPVDDHLLAAMSEKRRKVMDMFFSREGYEALLAQGVIRAPGTSVSGDQQTAGANEPLLIDSGVPVFEPGGAASVTVRIQRPAGKGQKYRVTTDLEADGLRSVFDFWRYPLIARGGRVIITPDDVLVEDVQFAALGGGGGTVTGRLELPSDEHPLRPQLQLTSIRLPVDALLVASIPRPKDEWVRSLHLSGVMIGTGEVYADQSGEVAFTIDSVLQEGSATPNAGAYTLDQVTGSVTVERTRVQLEDFTGRHGEGTITLNGLADYGDQGLGVELTFTGDNLAIEKGLVDLIPPQQEGRAVLGELFETYRPDGRIDAQLLYHGGGVGPDRFNLDVIPQTLGFDYAGQRIELSEMDGRIELTPSVATLHAVSGRFTSGSFKFDGEVRFGEEEGLALTFDIDADRIDASTRALLPAGVRTIVDRLAIQGPYSVKEAHLLTWPNAEQGPTRIFEGKVRLQGAQAELGVPVTEMDAGMDMRIVTFADQPWPHTDLAIHADKLRASDRLVENLSMNAVTGDRPWLIDLKDLKGTVYGGTVVGHGQLRMGEQGALGFELTLQETALEPFLNPLHYAGLTESVSGADTLDERVDPPTRDMSSGLLSASLSIRIPVDDPAQRQGRGIVTVRDARLYDRPLTLALLQAMNFTLPNESSFDRAAARFLIFGDNVTFDDIRFEAPAFAIAGSGTMSYPSMGLNLRMVTVNPTAPNLGAVSELVNTFKNELLTIEVTGTLAEPKARVVTFEGLFRSWGRVFGETQAPMTAEVPVEDPNE